MKLRTLVLVLGLAVVAFAGWETLQGRNPVDRVTALLENAPPAAPAPTPAPQVSFKSEETVLILSAPPRDSVEEGHRRFEPMAAYLSQVLGRKVVYRHPGTWGGYQADMQKNVYDLVFDGPHFVSWRVKKYHHTVLAKLPGDFLYAGFVRKDATGINDIKQLAGKTVCVHEPPNLGTLMLLNAFDNPNRQPALVITEGYENIYKNVQSGKCVGGMLPKGYLKKHDPDGKAMRVIYHHPPYPQQAITASTRLTPAERAKLAAALVTPAAETALGDFREAYALSGWFVPATNEEYAGIADYLKPVRGFEH